MTFDVQIKTGPHWQPIGTVNAPSSLSAARSIHRSRNVTRIRVRPEDSRDRWLTYRFRAR